MASAQDLATTKGERFKVNGGVSSSAVFYGVDGIPFRRDPFYWQIDANLNFSVFGMAIPFSATFTSQESEYSQPFNQVGFSPTYKAVTAHVGYRTMNFSTYTLGGVTFLGGGIEVKPEDHWINGGVMYGRLQRAVENEFNDGTQVTIPAFERWGYAGKVNLGGKKNNFDLILFHGKDDANSISTEGLGNDITPGENLVWGVNTHQNLAKKIKFNFEYAFSAYTEDIRNEDVILESFSYYNNLGGVFTPNSTTTFNKAIKTNLTFKQDKYNVKVAYRYIDPGYKTMGSPFLNNDLEDITGNLAWKMFKKKMNVALSGGFQRNNLDESQVQRTTRLISAANISFAPTKKINLTANVGNYNTGSNQVQYLELDSLEYFQVTSNASFGANYRFGGKKAKQSVNLMSNWQGAHDSDDNESDVYTVNLGHQVNISALSMSVSTSVNYNTSTFSGYVNSSVGPTLSISKKLFKKQVSQIIAASFLATNTDGAPVSETKNIRTTTSYRYKKNHSVSANFIYLGQNSFQEGGNNYNEYRVTIKYAYKF